MEPKVIINFIYLNDELHTTSEVVCINTKSEGISRRGGRKLSGSQLREEERQASLFYCDDVTQVKRVRIFFFRLTLFPTGCCRDEAGAT